VNDRRLAFTHVGLRCAGASQKRRTAQQLVFREWSSRRLCEWITLTNVPACDNHFPAPAKGKRHPAYDVFAVDFARFFCWTLHAAHAGMLCQFEERTDFAPV